MLAPANWVEDSNFLSLWFRQVRNPILGPNPWSLAPGERMVERTKGEGDSSVP